MGAMWTNFVAATTPLAGWLIGGAILLFIILRIAEENRP